MYVISNIIFTFYAKNAKLYHLSSKNIEMHQLLIYIWRITNEDWHNRFIQNLRKITRQVAMFCVKNFQGIRFFLFSFMLCLKAYSLKA